MTPTIHNRIDSPRLPKWSQMLMTGKPVTVDQAKDIILRTDRWLSDVNSVLYETSNRTSLKDAYYARSQLAKLSQTGETQDFELRYKRQALLRHKLSFVSTRYVRNQWAYSPFIFGPYGWCSPSGQIAFVDNVGKYPSVHELSIDWCRLLTAFPYLDLHVTLLNEESADAGLVHPLCNLRVANGEVVVDKPDMSVHASNPKQKRNIEETFPVIAGIATPHGLPVEWYSEYARKVSAVAVEVLTDPVASLQWQEWQKHYGIVDDDADYDDFS